MAFYQFKSKQFIPSSIDDVWEFISSPENLKHITPEHMGFDITSEGLAEKMHPGMIISYKVKPLLGIGMTWVTEITHVKEKEFFVDEQRIGPYSIWHHQHHLEEVDGGVVMRDTVSYRPPFGFLGAMANSLFIRRKLNEIFDYRFKAVENRFGKAEE